MVSSYPMNGELLVLIVLIIGAICCCTTSEPIFDENYFVTWGSTHVEDLQSEVELYLDQSSGAGIQSKQHYGSGYITMRIKVPGNDSGGVVTAFYLSSSEPDRNELDFEFLGNRPGKPYTLQTNVFVNGEGGREHRVHLWFDPALDFHTYKILWNRFHIVFFADNIPIRYFKNNIQGVSYPTRPMKIEASIWDGSAWATDGGQTKVIWEHAPFRAYFQGFEINGCPISNDSANVNSCYSSDYWWNHKRYRELNPTEQKAYKIVKDNFVYYDYCNDKEKHSVPPPECVTQ